MTENKEAVEWLEALPFTVSEAMDSGVIPDDGWDEDGLYREYGVVQTRFYSIKLDDEFHDGAEDEPVFKGCHLCHDDLKNNRLIIIGGRHDNGGNDTG